MKLKEFLAVGKSFADAPREKSPFEMRPGVRLPRFQNEPRFTTKQAVPVQTDWLAEKEHQTVVLPGSAQKPKTGTKRVRPAGGRRPWWKILMFGRLGEKPAATLVQEEMVLEKVRVMRNDLLDADLELVVNQKKKFALKAVKKASPSIPPTKKEGAEQTMEVERGVTDLNRESSRVESHLEIEAAKAAATNMLPAKIAQGAQKGHETKRVQWSELTVRLFELGQQ